MHSEILETNVETYQLKTLRIEVKRESSKHNSYTLGLNNLTIEHVIEVLNITHESTDYTLAQLSNNKEYKSPTKRQPSTRKETTVSKFDIIL